MADLKNPFKGSGKKPRPEKMPTNYIKSVGKVVNPFTNPNPKTRKKA